MSVKEIVKWLKENGEKHDGGSAFTYKVTEEPWMEFNAELQDWSQSNEGLEVLFIGYYFDQNGDRCQDPEFRIEIQDGEVRMISYLNWIAGAHDATNDSYAKEFIDLVWERHFENTHEFKEGAKS